MSLKNPKAMAYPMTLGMRTASPKEMGGGSSPALVPASRALAAFARDSAVSMPASSGRLGTEVKLTMLHRPLSTSGMRMAIRQFMPDERIHAPAKAATMSPTYWWHVHRPKVRPRPSFGNQLPMMAVLTGPPVACMKPWMNWVPANHAVAAPPMVQMGVETPTTIMARHSDDPARPMPTMAVGENRSPNGPVMNDPPAYVNMKHESMAANA